MARSTFLAIVHIAVLISISPVAVRAQLSPGDLNNVHADLEGLANCEKCHEARRQISPARCLDCHSILKERIDSGKGLHANSGYKDCNKCHVEHLGKDSELIWWANGRDNFDHKLTGYTLEGKHAGIECRKCHVEKNIADHMKIARAGKDPNRTFMGLDRDCLNCHEDHHRGQLGKDCLKCHAMAGWKPVSGFNHDRTDFPLTGKHLGLDCLKCHSYITDENDPENKYIKMTGIRHEGCIDCHTDIHKGKFDQNCRTCHNTSGWQQVNRTDFNHGKTRYPLIGKHASLACEKCHKPGEPLTGLKFAHCTDCHTDFHRRAFANRTSKGECSECHQVTGFTPAQFTIENHNKTDFPLEGSHLAIPCQLCHKTIYDNNGSKLIQFSFDSTKCIACHKDPHGDTVKKYMKTAGCESCHIVEGWQSVKFDHSASGFALEGRHARIACTSCHKPIVTKEGKRDLHFSGLSTQCLSCHNDIHRGQFAEIVEPGSDQMTTRCERCHTPGNWFPDRFDHNRDAAFKLEGAHRNVKCYGCHKKIEEQEGTFVWFKPLDTACKSCHGSDLPKKELKD